MRRKALRIAGVALLAAGAGCGPDRTAPPGETQQNPSVPAAETGASKDESLVGLSGEGFEIVFHAPGYTGGEFEQPSMAIKAGHVEAGTDGTYALVDVTATLYRDNEVAAEIHAGRGDVDEDKGIASLDGGVRVVAGTMTLDTDAIEWRDKADPPQAVSESPVHLKNGESDLQATGMTLIPSENVLTLTGVSGVWSQEGAQP